MQYFLDFDISDFIAVESENICIISTFQNSLRFSV